MTMDTTVVLTLCMLVLIPICSFGNTLGGSIEELKTCSKYDFEEKLLEKLVRIEHTMELNKDKMKNLEKEMYEKMKAFSETIDENVQHLKREEVKREELFQLMFKEMSNKQSNESTDFLNIVGNFTTDSEILFGGLMDRFNNLSKDIEDGIKGKIGIVLEDFKVKTGNQQKEVSDVIDKFHLLEKEFTDNNKKVGFTACGGQHGSNAIHFSSQKTSYGINMSSSYRSGIFTAQDGGFYFITVNILAQGRIGFRIKRNTVTVSTGYSDWYGGNTASSSAFVRLAQGENVSIQASYGDMPIDSSSCLTIMKI